MLTEPGKCPTAAASKARAGPTVRSIGPESPKPTLDSFYGKKGLLPASRERLITLLGNGEGGEEAAQRPSKCRLLEIMGTSD